ncbi:restriction endonuclease subunit S [Oscillatoria amoena NRMC-F 0135]|nr:restriction endonuclease subunit S [Oscillatoria amoena NRMC-F 0135]
MNKEKKLIPELRFPDFKNEDEWAKKELDEIAFSESSSMALNKLELKSRGYPVYGADSIVGYIDDFQQNEKYISIVKDGSGVGRLNLCQSHSSILGTLTCIKSRNQKLYHLDWIFYLLNTVDFSVYVKGAGIPHIYFSDFKKESVPVPNPLEQQKIASCLSSIDDLIAAHSQKLEMLKHQ